jgi:hypothetical protein
MTMRASAIADVQRVRVPRRSSDVASALLALAAFLGADAGIRAALPRAHDSDLGIKLDRLEEVVHEIDTVFIGSSVVHRQVDPTRFDEELGRRGTPTRSFNLGVRMMSVLEADYAVDVVLAMAPERLERVFLECRHLGVRVNRENLITARVTDWHDTTRTWRAIRLAATSERGTAKRVELVFDHLRAFAYRTANVGRLLGLASEHWMGSAEERSERALGRARRRDVVLGPRRDGFSPLEFALASENDDIRRAVERGEEPPEAHLGDRHRQLEEQRANFLARVADMRANPVTDVTTPPEEVAVYADLDQRLRAADLRPVFFSNPDVIGAQLDVAERAEFLRTLHRRDVIGELIDLSEPDDVPQLFDVRLRFDWSHLGAEGAAEFTRLLAERFAALR